MKNAQEYLHEVSSHLEDRHKKQDVTLTFQEFLEGVKLSPRSHIRESCQYILDTFDYFGSRETTVANVKSTRYKIFDIGTEKGDSIVGGEAVQSEIYKTISSFVKQGQYAKLILLHGPNGSSKSSTVDAIAYAMQKYSECPEGAIYRFNWIFPADKSSTPSISGELSPIGFSPGKILNGESSKSYAHLDDSRIASKIASEYKENPIFLLPLPYREEFLRKAIAEKEGISPEAVELPPHILRNSLSKRNQQIFENLLNAYHGNLERVFRHVQVERFYFSKQYRVGISTVEPQLRIDAQEKQLTMDRNISNIPSVLQTISFFEAGGELVEANRGLLEFSDLLKRPVETFKYLLFTIEKGLINLGSGSAHLDVVYIATSNEKHLDAFKQAPDFSSFKGRMELVAVPYLLRIQDEMAIYSRDIDILKKSVKVGPYALQMLATWAVMTRLKQPDTEIYDREHRSAIAKLDPLSKAKLYSGMPLDSKFRIDQKQLLKELHATILGESRGMIVYEGRFGASPREIRALLYRASQMSTKKTLSAMVIFNELRDMTRDKTIYEFLQFEPRGGYHDALGFIKVIEEEYCSIFEKELLSALAMVDETQYDNLLKLYIDHLVAQIKNERLYDSVSGTYSQPSEAIMDDVEKLLRVPNGDKLNYRKSLLSRIAAKKIENPNKEIIISEIFVDLLDSIKSHYYKERKDKIDHALKVMMSIATDDEKNFTKAEISEAKESYKNLENKFGYSFDNAQDSIKFLIVQNRNKNQSQGA